MPHLASRSLVALVPLLGIVAGNPSLAWAQDQVPPCPTYVIEGTISAPSLEDPESERMASVYVHTTGEPLSNRQVVATFTDSSGASVGEPEILVTDAGGRAEIAVPDSADSVNFVAESPDAPGCVGDSSSDPRVLLEIVPVGADVNSSDESAESPVPEEILAKTGPVSDAIAVASLLLLAFGAAVGTGKGRRRALARASGGVKSRFPR